MSLVISRKIYVSMFSFLNISLQGNYHLNFVELLVNKLKLNAVMKESKHSSILLYPMMCIFYHYKYTSLVQWRYYIYLSLTFSLWLISSESSIEWIPKWNSEFLVNNLWSVWMLTNFATTFDLWLSWRLFCYKSTW